LKVNLLDLLQTIIINHYGDYQNIWVEIEVDDPDTITSLGKLGEYFLFCVYLLAYSILLLCSCSSS